MLTNKVIKQLTNNEGIYIKGVQYFQQNKIKELTYDGDYRNFEGVVEDNSYDNHNVFLELNQESQIVFSKCSCMVFEEEDGICEHIVAILKQVQVYLGIEEEESIDIVEGNLTEQVNTPQNPRDTVKQQQEDEMMSYLTRTIVKDIDDQKNPLNMSVLLSLENWYSHEIKVYIELRIGEQQLYLIKDYEGFFQAMHKKTPMVFGKNFIYNPITQCFSDVDQRVLDIIELAIEAQKNIKNTFNGKKTAARKFNIGKVQLGKLLSILKDKPFDISINGVKYEGDIIDACVPMKINVVPDGQGIRVEVAQHKAYTILTEDSSFVLYCNKIYEIGQYQKRYIRVLLQTVDRLQFTRNNVDKFISTILPQLKKEAEIEIDREIMSKIYEEKLEPQVFLDYAKQKLYVKILFKYGNITIDAVTNEHSAFQKYIVVRDTDTESKIKKIFSNSAFYVEKATKRAYLSGEENIVNFLVEDVKKLQDIAEVFYSEQVEKINIKQALQIHTNVRLVENSNLLALDFQLKDVSDRDLGKILQGINDGKKYIKLSDETILTLDQNELVDLKNLMSSLEVDIDKIQDGRVEVPMFKAMYVEDFLEHHDLGEINKNNGFKKLVDTIGHPSKLSITVPSTLENILRGYQKVGFKWLKMLSMYGFGGILADDMGLGKTLQTISFILSEYKHFEVPSLIIAPTSLVYNWEEEINRFGAELKAVVVQGNQEQRQNVLKDYLQYDVIITSYAYLRRDSDNYQERNFAYCIIDEAQHIKNPRAVGTKAVKKINAKGRLALTGTPIENSLTELWSIFDFIMPGYLSSHGRFMNNFEKPIIKNGDQYKVQILRSQISPFILRRMKKDVLTELPPKTETKLTVELNDEQKKIYYAYVKQVKGEIHDEVTKNGLDKSRFKILAALTRLRQICCHPALFISDYHQGSGKLEALQEILADAVENDHKILIFSQFTSMLKLIENLLKDMSISYFYLDGSIKAYERGVMVKAFNQGERQVFLVSLKAGGTGLNLTAADMVIHFDPWWNPAVEEQATDRAYRIGQENPVQVFKLITKDTIEEKIFKLQEKKKDMIKSVIKPGENPMSQMTKEEIMALLD